MSDEEEVPDNVVDLNAARAVAEEPVTFVLYEYKFDIDDVGFDEDGDVVLFSSRDRNEGLSFSIEHAEKLGVALIQTAHAAKLAQTGRLVMGDDADEEDES